VGLGEGVGGAETGKEAVAVFVVVLVSAVVAVAVTVTGTLTVIVEDGLVLAEHAANPTLTIPQPKQARRLIPHLPAA
jgi:hypothetical protein